MRERNYSNLGKTFAKYVSFNMIGMFGISCYILADTFFIAKGLGTLGLTSLNLAIPIFTLMSGIALMIGMGSATKYTILKAMGENDEADSYFTQALFTALCSSMVFFILGTFFNQEISRCLGADSTTIAYTSVYVRTVMTFAPMFCMNHLMLSFVRNDGNPKLAMYATVAGSVANIIFDFIFIFPLKLEMFGAALATGMSPVAGLLILSTHWLNKRNQFHLCKIQFRLYVLIETVRLGFSTFVNEIAGGIVIINVTWFDTDNSLGVWTISITRNYRRLAIISGC